MQESKVCNRYAVLPAASTLVFEAKSSVHAVRGAATDLAGFIEAAWNDDGTIVVSPPPVMHVEFSIDKLRTGNGLEDREMARLLDSKRFPKVAADLKRLEPGRDAEHFTAFGEVTLAGRARRYEGSLVVEHDGDKVKVRGAMVLDIRDYGITPPSFLTLKVSPEVSVRMNLTAGTA